MKTKKKKNYNSLECEYIDGLNLFGETQININEVKLNDVDNKFIKLIKSYWDEFLKTNCNSRCVSKQRGLHDIIKELLKPCLISDRYIMISKSNDEETPKNENCEFRFNGLFQTFDSDITIYDKKHKRPVVSIGCKNPVSSFLKNDSSYNKTLVGESVNIQHPAYENNVKYFNFVLLFNVIPVYNKEDEIKSWDKVDYKTFEKCDNITYVMKRGDYARPYCILLCVLNNSVLCNDLDKINSKSDFINIHNQGYEINYNPLFDYVIKGDLLYNNISQFIKMIIDEVKEYDSKN